MARVRRIRQIRDFSMARGIRQIRDFSMAREIRQETLVWQGGSDK